MKNSRKHQLALLKEIRALRERIRKRVGTIDVIKALEESRDARIQELTSNKNDTSEGDVPCRTKTSL